MELWEKIKAAKEDAEAKYPMQSHESSWEERDMHIFEQMVAAATGQWEPPEPAAETPAEESEPADVVIPTPRPKED